MAFTISTDKIAIQSILRADPYLTEYLEFDPKEIYRVKATDDILGVTNSKSVLKQQIFIYNTDPEPTINPIIYGIIYEVDVSVPRAKDGTADLAIEQIMALLHGVEISKVHRIEIIDPPTVLSSETSLYQVGVRFVVYETVYNEIKKIPNLQETKG
ncbi:MAG: hypothetical protein K2H20_02710 [Bacilli bacterium]|nr:hypothetical protein [Bacilli bacterium]